MDAPNEKFLTSAVYREELFEEMFADYGGVNVKIRIVGSVEQWHANVPARGMDIYEKPTITTTTVKCSIATSVNQRRVEDLS